MDRLLTSRDTTDEDDFYKLLGCDESSTVDQISTEYKQLARKHHPDKEHSEQDKDEAERYFVRLEQAKKVLLDKDLRSKYDEWRNGGFRFVVSFNDWLTMQSRVHSSIHWASPRQKLPSLPEPETTPTVTPDDTRLEQDLTSAPSKKSSTETGETRPTSLQQFRRGSDGSSKLTKFRNYHM